MVLNMDNTVNSYKKNTKKKIIKIIVYSISGIFLGLIIVVVILFALNYFDIINIWPQSQTRQLRGITAKGPSGSHYVSGKKTIDGWIDELGWQENPVTKNGLSKATGIFKKWENIEDTRDKYVVLIIRNNDKYEETKFKVLYDNTLLSVYNLSIEDLNNTSTAIEKIGYINNVTYNKLYRLINDGDIISVYVQMKEVDGKFSLKKDIDGTLIAQTLEIRRFGGLNTINDELR